MHTVTLPAFEGPLDLLLQLVERAELDITAIALAQVADQYLAYVRTREFPDPRSMADFLALASRLLLIKSRALLPRPTPAAADDEANADDDAETLARQLREYQRYKQAATILRAWQAQGRRTFLRMAPPPIPNGHRADRLDHTLAELAAAVQRRIQLSLPLEEANSLPLAPCFTVADAISRIGERLEIREWISFEDIVSGMTGRQEVIVTFWAVLELLKQRAINVEQAALFGVIQIVRGGNFAVILAQMKSGGVA